MLFCLPLYFATTDIVYSPSCMSIVEKQSPYISQTILIYFLVMNAALILRLKVRSPSNALFNCHGEMLNMEIGFIKLINSPSNINPWSKEGTVPPVDLIHLALKETLLIPWLQFVTSSLKIAMNQDLFQTFLVILTN